MSLLLDIKNKRKRKSKRHKIFLTMAFCVAFATAYMLILPAITIGNNAISGFVEHQHSEACTSLTDETKLLVCTNESDHVHDENCYRDVDVLADLLVCKEENHEHDETCYEKVVKQELKCTHQHTDECKKTNENY